MAKLKNPLLSLKASGTIAKVLTFVRRGGVDLVEKKPEIKDAQTAAQLYHRNMFSLCKDLWHTLSAAEKAVWESQGTARHMTGYAWYISQCLRPNPGIYLPLAGGTMSGNILMGANQIRGLPNPTLAAEATRKAYVDALDRGEGHNTVLPLSYSQILQGTWVLSLSATQYLCAAFFNTTHDNGDSLEFKKYLAAGTYSLMFCHYTDGARGIVDFDIDAVEVASFDTYSGAAVKNVRSIQTGIIIAAPGLKTIVLRVDGKNPLSTDHYCNWNYFALWRTA